MQIAKFVFSKALFKSEHKSKRVSRLNLAHLTQI